MIRSLQLPRSAQIYRVRKALKTEQSTDDFPNFIQIEGNLVTLLTHQ